MPVYHLPPERNWGHAASDAMREFLRYYLLTKRDREDRGYRERELGLREKKFGIEESLAQSELQRNRAAADFYKKLNLSGGDLFNLAKRGRENKILGMGGPGKTLDNPMAVYGKPGIKSTPEKPAQTQGGLSGYDKPVIPVSPRGVNLSFRPQTSYPEGYGSDLKNAVSAIDRGADRYKVYQRIASQYPQYSTELKRILLFTTPQDRAQILATLLGIENE